MCMCVCVHVCANCTYGFLIPLKASKCVYKSPNVTKISHSTSTNGELYFQRNKIVKRVVYGREGCQDAGNKESRQRGRKLC